MGVEGLQYLGELAKVNNNNNSNFYLYSVKSVLALSVLQHY